MSPPHLIPTHIHIHRRGQQPASHMDGDGSFIPGSMPAFERASRHGRFEEGEEGGEGSGSEEEEDVAGAYFSKRVGMRVCLCCRGWGGERGVDPLIDRSRDGGGGAVCGRVDQPPPPPILRHSACPRRPPPHRHPQYQPRHSITPNQTRTHYTQAIPAGMEMEIALMREERERDQRIKAQ